MEREKERERENLDLLLLKVYVQSIYMKIGEGRCKV